MPAIKIYRPEEGARARGTMTALIGAMATYGVYTLYHWLDQGWWSQPLPGIGRALGNELPIDPRLFLVAAIGIGSAIGLYALHNYSRWADFLVDTEAELKKVSWASRKQVVQESLVVVVTVLILGLYVFGIDMGITVVQKRVPNWIHPAPAAPPNEKPKVTTWNDIWDLVFGARSV